MLKLHGLAKSQKKDGTDNPEGRAKNRRTEFKVVGSSDQESELNKGKLKIIYRDGDHTKTIHEKE